MTLNFLCSWQEHRSAGIPAFEIPHRLFESMGFRADISINTCPIRFVNPDLRQQHCDSVSAHSLPAGLAYRHCTTFKIPGHQQGESDCHRRNQQESSGNKDQLGSKFPERSAQGSRNRILQIE